MAEKFQPNGVVPSPEGQHRIATEHAELILEGAPKLRWEHIDLPIAQRLLEEMAEGVRKGSGILRRRHEQQEAGRCAAPGCKTKFTPTTKIIGTIVMNDPRTGQPRAYTACSRGCYAELEKLERETRIARFSGQAR